MEIRICATLLIMNWVALVPLVSNHQRIAELKLLYALLGWNHRPTHDSGNTIDVVLGLPGSPRAVTFDDDIGDSDHKLVCRDLTVCVFSHRWPNPALQLSIVHTLTSGRTTCRD